MRVETGWLAGLRCPCGSDRAIVAIEPGRAGEYAPGGVLLQAAHAPTGRCLDCAGRLGWLATTEAAA